MLIVLNKTIIRQTSSWKWTCRSGYRAWLEIMWALPAQVRILPITFHILIFFIAGPLLSSVKFEVFTRKADLLFWFYYANFSDIHDESKHRDLKNADVWLREGVLVQLTNTMYSGHKTIVEKTGPTGSPHDSQFNCRTTGLSGSIAGFLWFKMCTF